MKLASFDIFDTVLIRRCGSPDNIFYLMGRILFPSDIDMQRAFVVSRNQGICNAENRVGGNYTIEDIYNSSALSQEDFGYSCKDFIEIEQKIESENLVANYEMTGIIKKYRNAGYKIAFISDMYLPSSFLISVLKREDLFKGGDFLYVSCEHKARKSNGELYSVVKKELNPKTWHHYGDNYNSDIVNAKKYGIKTHIICHKYSALGERLISNSLFQKDGVEMSILAGLLRSLSVSEEMTPEKELAIDYVATLYVPYVIHVIQDAQKRGLKTLYFLSRDSFILMKIAEAIPHGSIDLKYLFVSRKSLEVNKDTDITESLAFKYLLQEGTLSIEQIGFVDVGWLGNTRRLINQYRQSVGAGKAHFYYWGVRKDILPLSCGTYSFFMNDIRSLWYAYIEEYCSACPFATTTGYIKKDGAIVPIYGKSDEKIKAIINANVDYSIQFVKYIVKYGIGSTALYNMAMCAKDNLVSYLYKIDFSPLEKIGDIEGMPLARSLTFREMLKIALGGKVTWMELASLEMTIGLRPARVLWRIHNKHLLM